MQPPPRLDLGNPHQPHSAPPPHFPPPPYREEPTPAAKPKSRAAKLLPTIITLAAFGGLAVLAWFAYQEGKNPVSDNDVPVIKADQEPFKHAPDNADSEESPQADKEVYNSFTSDKPTAEVKKAQAIPDSERPIDRSFLKQFAGTGEDESNNPVKQEAVTFGDNKKPDAKADAPLEAKPLPLAKANEALPTPNTGGVEVVKKIEAAKEEKAAEHKPVMDEAALKKAVEMMKPEEESAAAPEKQVVKKSAVVKAQPTKAPAKTKTAAKKEAAVTKKPVAAAKLSGLRVQLGAYRSDAEASHEWKKAVAKHKAALAGLKMMVQKVEIEGKGTMFRLQAGPVKSKDAARALCKQLVAAGQGCFIAK